MVTKEKQTYPVVTLETFTSMMNAIMEIDDEIKRFQWDVGKYFDNGVFELGSKSILDILHALENCFPYSEVGDKHLGSILSWWLWDSPDRGRVVEYSYVQDNDGTQYSLQTIPLLYEYLTTGKTSVEL